jgi:hypothetical protein
MSLSKPNFLIVGAAKSGTTTLYHYLRASPDIFLPDFKEPHYFASRHAFNFETIDQQDTYYDPFRGQHHKARGEASTAYLYFQDVPERIKRELPDCKIIALVRNPVERVLSMWGHQVREGLETRSLENAIEQELEGKTYYHNGVEFGFNYCRQGFIANNIEHYQECFGRDSVLIADYRPLREDPSALLQQVGKFLNVDTIPKNNTDRRFNASGLPKHAWLHHLLNSNHPLKRVVSGPLSMILTRKQRHALWQTLRNWNILRGTRHQMPSSTRQTLEELFAQETSRLDQLILESQSQIEGRNNQL